MNEIVTKGEIGEQDIKHYDGASATFTRPTSTGGTLTLNSVGHEVDVLMAYGGGVSYTQAVIEAALTAIGTVNKVTLMLRPGTWVISSNADWSAYKNVTFRIVPGAVISHGAFTVNIPNRFLDGGPFYWLTGTGTVTLSGRVGNVYPDEFGENTSPGTTDMKAAVTSTITTMFASSIATLSFTNQNYYLDSAVSVLFDVNRHLRLSGSSTSLNTSAPVAGQAGTVITGKAAIESMFILTKTDLTAAGVYSFEADHISFRSGALGITGPLTAIKNKCGGGPARPFSVHNCNFSGFSAAIVSDITTAAAAALTTGIGQVNIYDNNFSGNTYALKGMGGLNAIMDLDFHGNTSEIGGKILTTDSGLGGTFKIADNLLEGQADAIVLSCGNVQGYIGRNYFESNTNYIMQIVASNANSTLTVDPNFYQTCTGAVASFYGLTLIDHDDFNRAGIIMRGDFILGKSQVNNEGVLYPYVLASGGLSLALPSVPYLTALPPATLADGDYQTVTGSAEITPLGSVNVEPLNGAGNLYQFAIGYSANDILVFQALVRRRVSAGGLCIYLYDDAGSGAGNSDTSFPVQDSAIGEWVYVLRFVRATKASTGHFHWKWVTASGTQADVTDTYVYKIAGPVAFDTPIYLCLPSI